MDFGLDPMPAVVDPIADNRDSIALTRPKLLWKVQALPLHLDFRLTVLRIQEPTVRRIWLHVEINVHAVMVEVVVSRRDLALRHHSLKQLIVVRPVPTLHRVPDGMVDVTDWNANIDDVGRFGRAVKKNWRRLGFWRDDNSIRCGDLYFFVEWLNINIADAKVVNNPHGATGRTGSKSNTIGSYSIRCEGRSQRCRVPKDRCAVWGAATSVHRHWLLCKATT